MESHQNNIRLSAVSSDVVGGTNDGSTTMALAMAAASARQIRLSAPAPASDDSGSKGPTTTATIMAIASPENQRETAADEARQRQEQGQSVQEPKKQRLVWTEELHDRFLQAYEFLDSTQDAVPKKILQMMNEPRLTRENVASHLQKHRLNMKRKEQPVDDDEGTNSTKRHLRSPLQPQMRSNLQAQAPVVSTDILRQQMRRHYQTAQVVPQANMDEQISMHHQHRRDEPSSMRNQSVDQRLLQQDNYNGHSSMHRQSVVQTILPQPHCHEPTNSMHRLPVLQRLPQAICKTPNCRRHQHQYGHISMLQSTSNVMQPQYINNAEEANTPFSTEESNAGRQNQFVGHLASATVRQNAAPPACYMAITTNTVHISSPTMMNSMQNRLPEHQLRASHQAIHMSRVQCTRSNNGHLIEDSSWGSSFVTPQEMHSTISAVEHRHGSHPLSSDSVNNTNGSSQEDASNGAEQISKIPHLGGKRI